ncbi:hypothetical protein LINPERHAP2_LOCUS27329 [Linum perenne]
MQDRSRVWDEISEFKRSPEEPWSLIGDFNAIRSQEEKEGGNPTPVTRLQQFNEFINAIEVMAFTWCNNNRQGNVIKQRLDRGLCNGGWKESFPRSYITHELRIESDHSPILMRLENDGNRTGRRRFYYEAGWQNMEGYTKAVGAAWERGNDTGRNLTKCSKMLRAWKRDTFGANKQRIDTLKRELELLLGLSLTEEVEHDIDKKQKELVGLWKADEDYWSSRSGVQWAKFGDRNTRFFHLLTIQRRGRNCITRLKDSTREWIDEASNIRCHITDFFHNLFQAPKDVCDFSIVNQMPRLVTGEMNSRLCRQVEEWEIKKAVF